MRRERTYRMALVVAMVVLGVGAVAALSSALASAQEGVPAGEAAVASVAQVNTGPVFTYQGLLADNGTPVDGVCDFRFGLWDAETGGTQIGLRDTVAAIQVTDGRFTVLVNEDNLYRDFDRVGDTAFTGEARWLAIDVRCPAGVGNYTALSPRQTLSAAPVAHTLVPGALISGTGRAWDIPDLSVPPAALRVRSDASGIIVTAEGDGIGVERPVLDGVSVVEPGGNGVSVESPGNDGVYVSDAGRYGVYVEATSYGVRVDSPGLSGIEVHNPAANGVFVDTPGINGIFVVDALGDGVDAETVSENYYAGRFANVAPSGVGVGLYAEGNTGDAPDIMLGANGSSGAADNGVISSDTNRSTSDLRLESNDDIYLMLDLNGDEDGAFFVRDDGDNTVWSVDENGNTTASGTKSAVVDAGEYGQVKLYAVESPESWFEDFGTATLVAGEATVAIELVFAETVNLDESYHVYLTPLGDCPLYVAEKAMDAFTIRAMGGATCEIDVDYRVVAKRAGYEDLRLEVVEASEAERE